MLGPVDDAWILKSHCCHAMTLRQSTLSRSPVVVKPCAFLVVAHLIIIGTPDVAALYLVIIRECLRFAGW
jgi:hypothetical protein